MAVPFFRPSPSQTRLVEPFDEGEFARVHVTQRRKLALAFHPFATLLVGGEREAELAGFHIDESAVAAEVRQGAHRIQQARRQAQFQAVRAPVGER